MQQKNFFLFVICTALILVGWAALSRYLAPPPPPPKPAEVASNDESGKPKAEDKKAEDKKPEDKKGEEKKSDKKPDEKKAERKKVDPLAADLENFEPTRRNKLLTLGERDRDSRFHLFVEIDPHAAGVRSLLLNKFQAADPLGRPEWLEREGKKEAVPLEIIPAVANEQAPSFQLYAYDVTDSHDDRPLDTLGRIDWKPVGDKEIKTLDDGRRQESVSLQAESQGVIITKTYTVTEGEYHLGLAVKMRRKEGAAKTIRIRYQLTGAHGLPVEGKWYTSTFRNALIARVDKNGGVYRDLQTLQEISKWAGGNEIIAEEGKPIVYAAVANQFFASAIAVENNATFLRQVRPTLETLLTRGAIVSAAEDGSSFILKTEKDPEQVFYVPELYRSRFQKLPKGARVAVKHHTGSFSDKTDYPEIATSVFPEDALPTLWVDDVTVRVSTEAVELKGTDEVVHHYLLYNGPVKVSQLFPPPGLPTRKLEEGGVSPELYERYHDRLHLNTLTDYHSPGVMGRFADSIYWTALVIKCTNLMHTVLAYLHTIIPSYGLCIIVLTVLVRGMMFPLSRKQALMTLRMQQLAPELKKLQEKYKDDRQALGMAQMELYRKHGVNPFGSCWVLLLQMPIFMGLYFALQESTHFRLAEFWPTWIVNLAAPDMLISWSQSIPFISRVQDYGSLLYLGPYFNLLPVIAVILMIGQQKMMTPPPADEQQAMQQKMMKYMMIFFGLMFYKVAAGLCLYFIASNLWSFCERKLLPKKKPVLGEVAAPEGEGYFQKLLRRAQGESVTTAPAGVGAGNGGITTFGEGRGRSGGKRGRNRRRPGQPEEDADNGSLLGRWRKRLRDWWVAVLKEAEKKNRG